MEFDTRDKHGYFEALSKLHACVSKLDICDHRRVSLIIQSLSVIGFTPEQRREYSREARICPNTYQLQYYIDRYCPFECTMPEVTERMSLIGKLPKHWKEAITQHNLVEHIQKKGLNI